MTPAFESFQVGKPILEVIKAAYPPHLHIFMYIIYIYIIIYITYIAQVCLGLLPLREEESLSFTRQILVPGGPDPTVLTTLNLATEDSVELWRRKTAVVILKLLIKRDTNVTKGRRISKLDLEMIIQEGVDLMLMKDRQDLSMSSCNILGGNNFHFSRQS